MAPLDGPPPRVAPAALDAPGMPLCEHYAGLLWGQPWADARVPISGPAFDAMLAEVDEAIGHRARGPLPPLPQAPKPRPRPRLMRVPLTPPAPHRDAG